MINKTDVYVKCIATKQQLYECAIISSCHEQILNEKLIVTFFKSSIHSSQVRTFDNKTFYIRNEFLFPYTK